MKKPIIKIISLILILFLLTNISTCFDKKAYADGLTIAQLAAAAFAVGQSQGLNFSFVSGSSAPVAQSQMSNKINSWLAGRSIAEVFGSEILRVTAGKLAIAQTIYNGIKEFLTDLITDADIGAEEKEVFPGTINGAVEGLISEENGISDTGISCVYPTETNKTKSFKANFYLDGNLLGTASQGRSFYMWGTGWSVFVSGNTVICRAYYDYDYYGSIQNSYKDLEMPLSGFVVEPGAGAYLTQPWDDSTIDVGYQWEGDIDGAAPDTNLDQLIDTIFEDVADNNLVVDGEIVEPAPAPTPVPTFEPYPSVDDILPGINTGIEIGNDLIIGQQAQTGAITQGLEGVQEAVGSLEGTVEAIVDTPTSEELPDFKFDLRDLFPFCIPFDIYRLLSSFDAEPVAPHVQLPIVIQSIGFSYNLDLDFSAWNPVAQAMRTAELIVYAIGLAWATGKVIKW